MSAIVDLCGRSGLCGRQCWFVAIVGQFREQRSGRCFVDLESSRPSGVQRFGAEFDRGVGPAVGLVRGGESEQCLDFEVDDPVSAR